MPTNAFDEVFAEEKPKNAFDEVFAETPSQKTNAFDDVFAEEPAPTPVSTVPAAPTYDRRAESGFRDIASRYLGAGTTAQQVAGQDPGVYQRAKGSLNQITDSQDAVAIALRDSGGDIDKAIEMANRTAETASRQVSDFAMGAENPFLMTRSAEAGKFAPAAQRLNELKAELDKAGVPAAERPRIIADAAKANAWTENDEDNIRKLSTGELAINPGRLFGQKDELVAQINASDTSAEDKQEAIQRLDAMRTQAAEKLANDLYYGDVKLPGATDFRTFQAQERNKGNEDTVAVLDKWIAQQKDRAGVWKAVDAVMSGVAKGELGIGKTVVGGLAGAAALTGAPGAETLGQAQQLLSDTRESAAQAEKMRGLTGGYAITSDLADTVTQMAPMFAGGAYAQGLTGLSRAAVQGMSVYGWAAAQGYESKLDDAVRMAEEKKGSPLTPQEVTKVLGDGKTQLAGFLNGFQTAVLAKVLGSGVERAALGQAAKSMTVRDFVMGGGAKALRDGALKSELKAMGKTIFGKDMPDELVEEFSNQVLDEAISTVALGKDMKLGDLIENSVKAGGLGAFVGGALPQIRRTPADPVEEAARDLAAGAAETMPQSAAAATETITKSAETVTDEALPEETITGEGETQAPPVVNPFATQEEMDAQRVREAENAPVTPAEPTEDPSEILRARRRETNSMFVRDANGDTDRVATKALREKLAAEAGMTRDEWETEQARLNVKAKEDFFGSLNEGDTLTWTDGKGDLRSGVVEIDISGQKKVRDTTEGSATQDYLYSSHSGEFDMNSDSLIVTRSTTAATAPITGAETPVTPAEPTLEPENQPLNTDEQRPRRTDGLTGIGESEPQRGSIVPQPTPAGVGGIQMATEDRQGLPESEPVQLPEQAAAASEGQRPSGSDSAAQRGDVGVAGSELSKPTLTFYRGTTPGDERRIAEPFSAAKGMTFVARKPESAKVYGSSVEQITAKPDAKILREEDPAFWKVIGRKRPPNGYIGSAGRKGETMVDVVNDAITKVKAAGYDILSFASDTDIGTIILNEQAVSRQPQTPITQTAEEDVPAGVPQAGNVETSGDAGVAGPEVTLPEPTESDWKERGKFVGEDFAGPPNSVVIQPRDLDSNPVGEPVILPLQDSMDATAAMVASGFTKAIGNGSWRESLVKVIGPDGRAFAQMMYDANSGTMKVADQRKLEAARTKLAESQSISTTQSPNEQNPQGTPGQETAPEAPQTQAAVEGGSQTGKTRDYSIESLKTAFNLTDEQAVVADAIRGALGAKIDLVTKGGVPGSGALAQGENDRFTELTKDLPAKPTAADLDAWRESHPDEYRELKEMRERVLREAGYSIEGWHGTAYEFTVPKGHRGVALHVALSKKLAEDFAQTQAENVRHIVKTEGDQMPGESTEPILLNVLGNDNLFDPRIPEHRDALLASLGSDGLNLGGEEIRNADYDTFETKTVLNAIKQLGFAGYYESEKGNGDITSYAVFEPSSVKSTEPLNLDESGNLIPPSQWGDTGSPSILYQMPGNNPTMEELKEELAFHEEQITKLTALRQEQEAAGNFSEASNTGFMIRIAENAKQSAEYAIGMKPVVALREKLLKTHAAAPNIAKEAEARGNRLVFRMVRNMEEATQILEGIKSGNLTSGFRNTTSIDGHALSKKAPAISRAEKKGAVPVFTSPYPTVSKLYEQGAALMIAIEYAPDGEIYVSSRAGQTQGMAYSATFADSEHVIDARSIKDVKLLTPDQVALIAQYNTFFDGQVRRGAYANAFRDKDSELTATNLENSRNLLPIQTTLGRPFTEVPAPLPNGLGVMKGQKVRLKNGAVAVASDYRLPPAGSAWPARMSVTSYKGSLPEISADEIAYITKQSNEIPKDRLDIYYEGSVDNAIRKGIEVRQSNYKSNVPLDDVAAVWDKDTKKWVEPSVSQTLQQDAKASFEITETGKILLRGLQNPDFTSAVHEISHAAWLMVERLERQYAEADAAGTPLELDLSRNDIKSLRQWSTMRDKQWEKGGGENWSKSKKEGRDRYAKEKWARAWERYFREGKAPQQRLQAIFDKIAGWMAEVYATIKGSPIDVEITPEVRAIMDKLAARMEINVDVAMQDATTTADERNTRKVGDIPNEVGGVLYEGEAARGSQTKQRPNQAADLEWWLGALGKVEGLNAKERAHTRLIVEGKENKGTHAYATINRPPSQIALGRGRAYDEQGIIVTDAPLSIDEQMSLQVVPVDSETTTSTAKQLFAKGFELENNGKTYLVTPSTTSSSLRVTELDAEGPTGHIHLDNRWFVSDLRKYLLGAKVFDELTPDATPTTQSPNEQNPQGQPGQETTPEAGAEGGAVSRFRDIAPDGVLYRADLSSPTETKKGAFFFSGDKEYTNNYLSDERSLVTAKIPEKVLDIRDPQDQEIMVEWLKSEAKRLSNSENFKAFRAGEGITKALSREDTLGGINQAFAIADIARGEEAGAGIYPGIAYKAFLEAVGYDAMTVGESVTGTRDKAADFSFAILKPEPVSAPSTPDTTPPTPQFGNPPVDPEFQELQDLSLRRGQAQNKVKGVKFSAKDEARFKELSTKFRDQLFETVDPATDPVVGVDINGTNIQQSKQGTFYTFENGRVRTGPAFSEETPAPEFGNPPVDPLTTEPLDPNPPPPELPNFDAALDDDSVTGLYHAQTDADRARLGLPPRFKQPRTTDQAAWDRATAAEDAHRAAGKPGTAGTDLLTNLLSDVPRVLTKDEHALLLHEKLVREQAVEAAQSKLNSLPATTTEGERKDAQAAVKSAQDAFDLLVTYADAAGSRAGLSLQARKMLINTDFTLAAVVNRLKAAKNMNSDKPAEWTEKDQKAAVEISEKLQQAQARVESLEAENSEQAALIEQLTKDVERAQTKLENRMRTSRARKLVKEKLDPLVEAAKARMAARKGQSPAADAPQMDRAVFGPTPEQLEDLKDIGIISAGWLVDKTLTLQEFSSRLIAEFGDWVAEHAQNLFRNARSLYIETAESVTPGGTAAPTPESVVKDIDAAEPLDKADVWKLARAHVVAGKRGRNVLDSVFADLSTVFPDLTRDEVATIFTDYGKVVYPSPKEVPAELRRIRSLEREYLKQSDIAAGQMPKRTGYQGDVNKGPEWAEVRAAQQATAEALRELENQLREAGLPVPSDERKLANALGTMKRRLTNEIEEIELALRTKTARAPKTRTPVAKDAEVLDLEKRLAEKRAEYAQVFKDETARERRILGSIKKRREELERRIRERDFSRPPAKEPVNTEATRKAQYEFDKLRAQYDEMRHQYMLANAPFTTKTAHYLMSSSNLLKLLTLGMDIGVVMRQLGTSYQALTRDLGMLAPTKEGAKLRADGSYLKRIISTGIKAFGSTEAEHAIFERLRERPLAGWDKVSGLVLNAPFDLQRNSKEDIPPANLIDEIPWWVWPAFAGLKVTLLGTSFPAAAAIVGLGAVTKPLMKSLDRAQRAMTNESRALFHDEALMALHDGHPTVQEAKAIAKAVMVGTGRGTATQKIEAAIPLLNQVLLATRYYFSRIQALTLYPLLNKDARSSKEAQKQIAKMYGRSVAGRAALYGLAALAFGKALTGDDDDPEEGLIVDPFNPNLGRVKLADGVSLDFMSGFNNFASAGARYFWKTRTDPQTGRKIALGSGYANNVNDEALRFLQSKMNIQLSFILNSFKGEYFGGKPVTPVNALEEITTAIIINDTLNTYKAMIEEYGPVEGAAKASLFMSLMFGGAGTSVQDDEAVKEANKAARKEAEWMRKQREAELNQ